MYCYTISVEFVFFTALPSNLTFANATKEKILHGKENTTLHILCSVQDGIPDSLSIIRNNKTVKSDEDSSLEYILLPTRLDHGLKYTCEAWSSLLKQPLKEIIHLDIKCKKCITYCMFFLVKCWLTYKLLACLMRHSRFQQHILNTIDSKLCCQVLHFMNTLMLIFELPIYCSIWDRSIIYYFWSQYLEQNLLTRPSFCYVVLNWWV